MRVPLAVAASFYFSLLLGTVTIRCAAGTSYFDEAAQPETVHFDTGGLSRESLPNGFVFGTATSAYQVEAWPTKTVVGPAFGMSLLRSPVLINNN